MLEGGDKIRVLLVDDQELFREALAELIGLSPDIRMVGTASSIAGTIEFLRTETVDVILLDYVLGEELAFDLFQRAPDITSRAAILILSGGINEASAARLMACGVVGVLWKHTRISELTRSIRRVAAELSLERNTRPSPAADICSSTFFTERQLYVARAILRAKLTKEIAGELGVSESSVKCTVQQLFHKSGTRSRPELVRTLLERYPDHILVDRTRIVRVPPAIGTGTASMARASAAGAR